MAKLTPAGPSNTIAQSPATTKAESAAFEQQAAFGEGTRHWLLLPFNVAIAWLQSLLLLLENR